MEITKEFKFASAHRLNNPNKDEDWNKAIFGKCNNLPCHGHTWKLFVTLYGWPNKDSGMIMNFHELKEIINEKIVEKLDHKYLNDVVDFLPTCENLILWIWEQLKDDLSKRGVSLHKLVLFESPTSQCMMNDNDYVNYQHLQEFDKMEAQKNAITNQ